MLEESYSSSPGRVAGQVTLLRRYPVKSMGGEPLEQCRVEESGLRGDRVRLLLKERSDKQLTAREQPGLLHYAAEWTENSGGSDEGSIKIRTPDNTVYDWAADELAGELQMKAGEPLAWMVYGAEDPLTGVDDAPVLLVTEASLAELGRLWKPERDLWRRFRPNVIVRTEEPAFAELSWTGRHFRLGEAELEVIKGCERCSMITIHPETLEKDPSLLKLVNERCKGLFGVYARVVKKGTVRKGDPFEELPEPASL
ncbi:MOSC domain-containing protein [Gorillibacterium sp. sgz5001074]|uniref:MOSC domain-containing protein n=1 Tax=Gorillibacterium sp. sgz5001074 TaxID=3446695 RepID=UPI003F678450